MAGEIEAKVKLNTTEFSSGMDDVKNIAQSAASSISSIVAKASAVVGAAVTAAAVGVTKIVTDSVKSFGEYEQLVGGAKKIFDQMNYEQIAADAADAWKTMNLSASQYLSMINDVGASFAATMGDKKGYETAKTGMQAIADYASGTGKNVELLNQKFAMITRAASSYQSIADQFSGILPATSKDFLEQAQAAGFLSTKYEELTKVPVAEYQEAVSKMLEKGVADLNLTGNTAAETMNTITGSIAGLKSAWSNLITGMSDDSADLGKLIDNVVVMAETALKNILPAVSTALQGIGKLIANLAPVIAAELPGLVSTVGPMILGAAVSIVETLTASLPGLIDSVSASLMSILPQFAATVVNLLNTLASNIVPSLFEFAVAVVVEIGNSIAQNAQQMADSLFTMVNTMVMILANNLPAFITAGIQIIAALGQSLAENAPLIVNSIVTLVVFTAQTIIQNLPLIIMTGLNIILALAQGLLLNLNYITDSLVQMIGMLVETIIMNIPMIIEAGLKIGLAIVEGILLAIPSLLVSIGRFLGIVDEAETHMVEKTTGMSLDMSNTALAVQNDAMAIESYINSASMSVTSAAGSMQNTTNMTTVGVYDSMGNLVSSFQTTATASATTSADIMSNANNTVLAIDQTNNQAITSMNQLRTGVSSASAEIISDVNANAIHIETSARTLIDKLWSMFEKFYIDVVTAIDDMMNQITDLMMAIGEMNMNFVGSIDDMKYGLDMFVFGVSDSFETVYHESVQLGDKLSSGVLDIMDYLNDKVSSATSDIMSAFQDSADAISDAAQIAKEAAESADNAAGVASKAADSAAVSAAKAWASVAEAESAAAVAASLASSFGGGRASGGPVSAGSTYLVGEQGPELITMSRSGYVHNANETADLLGYGGENSLNTPEAGLEEALKNFFRAYLEPFMMEISTNTRIQADKPNVTTVKIGQQDIVDAYDSQKRSNGYSFVR